MENDKKSIFEQNIQRGKKNGIISFNEDENRIMYHCARNYSTSFKNPEEKVRAAYFVELVLDYKYPKERINFEVPVPRRTPEDRADIVVYEDDELKKPYLVVECKKDGITDAEFKQAIEQVFGNANSLRAKYAIVVAGTTRTAFDVAGFKPNEREKNVISDIPKKYGKAPKYRFIKGDVVNDIKIVSKDELIRALQKSHDTVWQGGKLAPTTAFDEVSKLLFCKLKDEKDTPRGKPYKFQIGTHETAEEVFYRINEIYQKAKQQDAEVFKEDIKLEPKIVYSVVEHLQGIAFNKTDLDTKGVAFETFMRDFFKGKMGQFFTPREIIRFIVKMLNPTKDDFILDPAAGSGGFLLNSLDHVREYVEINYDKQEAWEHWHSFAKNKLYGIEINDQIARVCKMNMIIHDDGHTNVINTDALIDFEEIQNIHKGFKKDHFDIILTNPPFGAKVKETEKEYLNKYNLGSRLKKRKSQKTEILFIERVIDFVKSGTGKIGIVLPDGILTNSSLQYVRDYIMEKCQILAIISLPQFAFNHYGAGVKTSLLFLRKKAENEKLDNYPIFMAIAEHIGYDATGKKDIQNDLNEIYDAYISNKNLSKPLCFHIKYDEIKKFKRLDPNFYNPEYLKVEYELEKSLFPIKKFSDFIIHLAMGMSVPDYKNESNEVPFIMGKNLKIGYLDLSNLEYISKKTSESHKSSILKEGDILFSVRGAYIGKVAVVPKELENGNIINNIVKITIDTQKLLPEYVVAFLSSDIGQKLIYRNVWGGAQPGFTNENIRNLKIPVPPINIQRKIVEEVKIKREKAEQLQKKAKELLEDAKKEVENIILNGGKTNDS